MLLAREIRDAWQSQSDVDRPYLLLKLADQDPRAAATAIGSAGAEARAELVTGRDPDDYTLGQLIATARPDGAYFSLEGPLEFDRFVELFIGKLDLAGLSGTITLADDAHEPWPTDGSRIGYIECAIRLKGSVSVRSPRWWVPTESAFESALAVGREWCRASGAAAYVVSSQLITTAIERVELDSAFQILVDRQEDRFVVASSSEPFWRAAVLDRDDGRLVLLEGGDLADDGAWERSFANAEAVLAEATEYAVYGFVKRGSRPHEAVLGTALQWDVADARGIPASFYSQTFEWELVPDASGSQLLNPNHLKRGCPPGERWARVELADGYALVRSRQPSAWFSDDRPSEANGAVPTMDEARADFAALLLSEEAVQDYVRMTSRIARFKSPPDRRMNAPQWSP